MNLKNMLKVYNTYIHIPFCEKKCNYCDFTSFPSTSDMQDKYVDYLIKEINLYKDKYDISENQKTIYFGGGTPSLLSIENITKILEKFNFNSETEITIEVNPKTVNRENLIAYKKLGINRLSIGVQSFNEELLKILGRIHNRNEAIEIYNLARELGFKNISLDLMFSLPNQKIEDLEKDLEILFFLNPEHFSIYSLIWEEGTKFYRDLIQGKLKETENELEAEMFETIIKKAKERGYRHYEISNFSKLNYESKHNMNYWENNNYLGVGLAAAGYLENNRYKNFNLFKEYYKNLDENKLPSFENELLTEEEIEEYKYLVGFRMLDKEIIPKDKFKKICEKMYLEKYLSKTEKGYIITNKGLMYFNDFISNFI